MIKLSDVKVRPQYRTWVRHRLIVLEYAWAHGPAAAGRHYRISARTIRRWRKRWRSSGVEGLVPSYPRHRPRQVAPAAIELVRHARQELGYGPLGRASGCNACMGSGSPWARFNGYFGTSGCPASAGPASGNPAK
jgi:hypothetical protein